MVRVKFRVMVRLIELWLVVRLRARDDFYDLDHGSSNSETTLKIICKGIIT